MPRAVCRTNTIFRAFQHLLPDCRRHGRQAYVYGCICFLAMCMSSCAPMLACTLSVRECERICAHTYVCSQAPCRVTRHCSRHGNGLIHAIYNAIIALTLPLMQDYFVFFVVVALPFFNVPTLYGTCCLLMLLIHSPKMGYLQLLKGHQKQVILFTNHQTFELRGSATLKFCLTAAVSEYKKNS